MGNTYKVEDLTKISEIVECTEDTYKSLKQDYESGTIASDYFLTTMFLVNLGTSLSSKEESTGAVPYTDVYYGTRKVSDFMVVDRYPKEDYYPNGKIYLQAVKEQEVVKGYRIYFKISGTIIPVASSESDTFLLGYDNNGDGTVTFNWIVNNKEMSTRLILADPTTGLPDSTIMSQLKEYLKTEISKEVDRIVWTGIE